MDISHYIFSFKYVITVISAIITSCNWDRIKSYLKMRDCWSCYININELLCMSKRALTWRFVHKYIHFKLCYNWLRVELSVCHHCFVTHISNINCLISYHFQNVEQYRHMIPCRWERSQRRETRLPQLFASVFIHLFLL